MGGLQYRLRRLRVGPPCPWGASVWRVLASQRELADVDVVPARRLVDSFFEEAWDMRPIDWFTQGTAEARPVSEVDDR